MKLYTEEQVRKAIELAQECEHECGGVYFDYTETEVLDELTPIELPSDDEIQKEADAFYGLESYNQTFIRGAKWMLDKLTSRNNERK